MTILPRRSHLTCPGCSSFYLDLIEITETYFRYICPSCRAQLKVRRTARAQKYGRSRFAKNHRSRS